MRQVKGEMLKILSYFEIMFLIWLLSLQMSCYTHCDSKILTKIYLVLTEKLFFKIFIPEIVNLTFTDSETNLY